MYELIISDCVWVSKKDKMACSYKKNHLKQDVPDMFWVNMKTHLKICVIQLCALHSSIKVLTIDLKWVLRQIPFKPLGNLEMSSQAISKEDISNPRIINWKMSKNQEPLFLRLYTLKGNILTKLQLEQGDGSSKKDF